MKREYRIGMVEPNKGSTMPPKGPLLTRAARNRAENARLLREEERKRKREEKNSQ